MPNSNSPETIAYRLTQVENAVKELTSKIDGVISGFATHKDMVEYAEAAKQQAKLEHNAIYEKIGDVETDVSYLKSRNWVHNTLSAILGSVFTFLLLYFLQDIVK